MTFVFLLCILLLMIVGYTYVFTGFRRWRIEALAGHIQCKKGKTPESWWQGQEEEIWWPKAGQSPGCTE